MTNPSLETNPTDKRLLSLDALRGFDMLWILGLNHLAWSFANATDYEWADALQKQFTHASWHGFLAWDLIFPLFMFLVGVSIAYSIVCKLEQGVPRSTLAWKIVRRTVLLFLFGMIYNGVLKDFSNPRYASVLGQISVGYFVAAAVVLFGRSYKSVLLAFLAVSAIVTVAQLCIPVQGHGANVLTQEGCMNAYLDQLLLPGAMYREHYDPQGVLCMISGAGVTLMGVLTGLLLRREDLSGYRKTAIMAGSGVVLVLAAWAVNPWYPVNKEIWTTTFNLLTGGISLLLLAIFYLLIDVLHFTRWSFPFRVIGMNAITIYMAARLFDFKHTSWLLFGGLASLCGEFTGAAILIGAILIQWLLLLFLYKRKIFLRI